MGIPVDNPLAHGEKVVNKTVGIINRRGREKVLVRVVGSNSIGWLESALAWGGVVEAVVHSVRHKNRIALKRFGSLGHLDYSSAAQLPPLHSFWNGVMLATLGLRWDEGLILTMIQAWRPLIVIISMSASHSRSQVQAMLRDFSSKISTDTYTWRTFKPSHSELGGVTMASCIIIHGFRKRCDDDVLPRNLIMTAGHYKRTLQTVLDDTVGRTVNKIKFDREIVEINNELDNVVGHVKLSKHDPVGNVDSGPG